MINFKKGDFVTIHDSGYQTSNGDRENFLTHFEKYSIALVRNLGDKESLLYLIGENKNFLIQNDLLAYIDVTKTGKGFDKKICNICHVLKSHFHFSKNQTDAKGRSTSRPSCKKCRRDIDKRSVKLSSLKKAMEKKPKKGTLWQCPICRKRSIVGVTAKVVLDHDHAEGKARAFLCDSCNTGLGRFKNGSNYLKNPIAYLKQFEK